MTAAPAAISSTARSMKAVRIDADQACRKGPAELLLS